MNGGGGNRKFPKGMIFKNLFFAWASAILSEGKSEVEKERETMWVNVHLCLVVGMQGGEFRLWLQVDSLGDLGAALECRCFERRSGICDWSL